MTDPTEGTSSTSKKTDSKRHTFGSHGFVVATIVCGIFLLSAYGAYRTWVKTGVQLFYYNHTNSSDMVLVTATIPNVAFEANSYYITVFAEVFGSFASNPASTMVTSHNLTINCGGDSHTFVPGSYLFDYTLSQNFQDGDLTDYPFDGWSSTIVFTVLDNGNPIPFNLILIDSVPSNILDSVEIPEGNVGNSIVVDVNITRAQSAKAVSMLMTIFIWLITFIYICATYKIVKRRRPEPLEIATLGATMIFAMTSVRGMQPGVPPFECRTDMFGFFWCTLIQAGCFVAASFSYITHKKDDESHDGAQGLKAVVVDKLKVAES